LDGSLESAQAAELAGHLEACPACRGYAGRLEQLGLELLEAPEPSRDFVERLMQRVAEQPPPRRTLLSRPGVFRPLAAGLGIAAALAGFALGLHLQPREQTTPQRGAQTDTAVTTESVEVAAANAINPLAADSVESVLLAVFVSEE